MSEREYVIANEKDRILTSVYQDNSRDCFRFSRKARGFLGCKSLSELEKGIKSEEELLNFRRYILQSKEFKWTITSKEGETTNYVVYRKNEDSQRMKSIQNLDSFLEEDEDSPFFILDPEQQEDEEREKKRSRTTTSRDIRPIIERIEYISREEIPEE